MYTVTIEDPEGAEHVFNVDNEEAAGFLEYAALELNLEYEIEAKTINWSGE